jgi:hypothetical protein
VCARRQKILAIVSGFVYVFVRVAGRAKHIIAWSAIDAFATNQSNEFSGIDP